MKAFLERILRATRALGRLATGAFVIATVFATSACSPPVRIKDVTLMRKSPTAAQYQVICMNDDSKGTVFVRAFAETADHRRTTLYQPGKVQAIDEGASVTAAILRPDPTAFDADEVVIEMYTADNVVIDSKTLHTPLHWDARTLTSRGAQSTQLDIDSGFVFLLLQDFMLQDFDSIDETLRRFKDVSQHEPSGHLPMDDFRQAMQASYYTLSPQKYMAAVAKWRLADPQGVGAAIAEAIGSEMIARNSRRSQLTRAAPDAPARVADGPAIHAEKALDGVDALGKTFPLWYLERLWAGSEVLSDSELRARFAEATSAFPAYTALYVPMSARFAPPYANNWDAVEELVNGGANRIDGPGSSSGYADIYLRIADAIPDSSQVIRGGRVDMPRMRAGLLELLARYPTDEYLNRVAAWSCMADDRDMFMKSWPYLGTRVETQFWPDNYSPDLCRHHFKLDS